MENESAEEKLRKDRTTRARTILNHPGFQRKPEEQKQRAIEVMVRKGLRLDDLQMLKDELDRRFNILDANVLIMILLRSKPKAVLSACRINKQYANVCRKTAVFETLMRAHYPDSILTDNPKQQYVSITEGVETTYLISELKYEERGLEGRRVEDRVPHTVTLATKVGKSQRPESTADWSLSKIPYGNLLFFLGNPLYLAWVSRDKETYRKILKAKDMIRDYNLRLYKGKPTKTEQLQYSGLITFLDEQFQIFMKDYRERGLEGLEYVRDFLKKHYVDLAFEYYDEMIRNILQKGKLNALNPLDLRMPERLLFLKGNTLPSGTLLWVIIKHHKIYQEPIKMGSREEIASYFAFDGKNTDTDSYYYEDVRYSLIDQFETYINNEPPDPEQVFGSPEEIIQTSVFNDYLMEALPELVPFSRQKLYEHVMTHNSLAIFDSNIDFLFIPVLFQ